jgi:S-formylglutathione hydrolase
MSKINIRDSYRCADGEVMFCTHDSESCAGPMNFAVFMPPESNFPPPVVYWLSGLTCSEENFMIKAGAQQHAARLGLAIVAPDTSPRTAGVDGEEADWDLGTGAGFYVDATQAPWSAHYQMQTWVSDELPALIASEFPVDGERLGITGHSMGGHGAIVSALRNPDRYRSVSAFAPIVAPTQCPWGQKAFSTYLGDDKASWESYDSCCLIANAPAGFELLVDQGLADNFLAEQLKPHLLEEACRTAGVALTLNRRDGYDHSYYFISSFIGEHLEWHESRLRTG